MHIEKREDPLVEMGYEIRDVNTKAIAMSTVYFFAFAIGSGIIGYILFILMNPGVKAYNEGKVAERRMPLDKKTPLVQSNMEAKTDMMTLRQMENSKLHGAPTQNQNGKYTIPIEAAMKMVAENGGRNGQAVDVNLSTPRGGEVTSNGVAPLSSTNTAPEPKSATEGPHGGEPSHE